MTHSVLLCCCIFVEQQHLETHPNVKLSRTPPALSFFFLVTAASPGLWQVIQDSASRYTSKLERAVREPDLSPRLPESPTKSRIETMKAHASILSEALEEDFPELYTQAAEYKRLGSPRKAPITVPRSSAPVNHRCAMSSSMSLRLRCSHVAFFAPRLLCV